MKHYIKILSIVCALFMTACSILLTVPAAAGRVPSVKLGQKVRGTIKKNTEVEYRVKVPSAGTVVLKVKGTSIAIGASLAKCILV